MIGREKAQELRRQLAQAMGQELPSQKADLREVLQELAMQEKNRAEAIQEMEKIPQPPEGEMLRSLAAHIRDDFFDYGKGYDGYMDMMMGDPVCVLEAVCDVLNEIGDEKIHAALKYAWSGDEEE